MSGGSRSSDAGFAMQFVGASREQGGRDRDRASASERSHRKAPMTRDEAFGDEVELNNSAGYRDGSSHHREEALTGFSRGSAGRWVSDDSNKEKGRGGREKPKVIVPQKDVNWWEERRRRLGMERMATREKDFGSLGSMRTQNRDSKGSGAVKERIGDEEEQVGLHIRKKTREQEEEEEIRRLQDGASADTREEGGEPCHPPAAAQTVLMDPEKEGHDGAIDEGPDEDKQARVALLSGGFSEGSTEVERTIAPISEEDALRRDADSRPDAPTLDDYEKMPVQDFGAALLRGMGWKEGMGAGRNRQGPTQAPEVKKRAALLGLGAKERKVDEERDPKKGSMNKRPERRYVPLVKKGSSEAAGVTSPSSPSRSLTNGQEDRRKRRDRSYSPQRHDRNREQRRRAEDPYRREQYDRDREKKRERGGERSELSKGEPDDRQVGSRHNERYGSSWSQRRGKSRYDDYDDDYKHNHERRRSDGRHRKGR